ncbi:MAG TPA: preprotein translocase subunit SecE, partial [Candidatus Krumholzibacteria bacterium]|nr:preprotein translocase subunit SecE [Candidatus Krumholzibacteria bacterium]
PCHYSKRRRSGTGVFAPGRIMFKRFGEFLKEVRVELGKITWPTRAELKESTIVVIASAALLTVFIGVVDQIFNWLWRTLLKS